MSTPAVTTLIDEQLAEVKARVRGTIEFPASMRVADLPQRMKADWLKRRPMERRK